MKMRNMILKQKTSTKTYKQHIIFESMNSIDENESSKKLNESSDQICEQPIAQISDKISSYE